MKNRTILGIVAGVLLTPLSVITATAPVHADSGAGYTYTCARISMTQDSYHLALAKIWSCSNGYMDNTSVSRTDNYSGKNAGWATGECLWILHKDYNYAATATDQAKAWAFCSANHGWPGKGIKNPPKL